jgi:hypothetical protein
MPQRAKGLTAAVVEKGTKPRRYGDGVYLLVRSRHAKFWLFRYLRRAKNREMGLGPATWRATLSSSIRHFHTARSSVTIPTSSVWSAVASLCHHGGPQWVRLE